MSDVAYAPPPGDSSDPPARRDDTPPADPLRARMDAAFDKSQRYIDRTEASMERESALAEEKTRALAPIRAKQLEFASRPLPEMPQLQTAPPTPKHDRHEDEDWLFAASLLGSLGGALTRRHVTNALGAFQGAMEGYAQGSKQAFDQNFKTWEAENRRVQDYNKQVLERYRNIMENRKYSVEQMSVELQMAAAQYEDQAMATAAKSKNFLVMAQLVDKQAEALGKMDASEESLKFKYAQMQSREKTELLKAQMRAAGYGTDPSQMQATVDAIIDGRAAPIRGRAGTQIMNEVYRQSEERGHPFNENEFAEKKYRQLMAARAEAAGMTAAERAAGTRGANLEMILRTTRELIPQALESSRNVDRSAFVQLNQLVQAYEKNLISDPALKKFTFDTIQVAEGWARAMNAGGVMRVDDRNIALSVITTVDGPAAYEEALRSLDMSMVREIKAVHDQRTHAPVAPSIFPPRPGESGAPPAAGGDLARDARAALAAGADPAAVFKRMQEMGADPSSVFMQ